MLKSEKFKLDEFVENVVLPQVDDFFGVSQNQNDKIETIKDKVKMLLLPFSSCCAVVIVVVVVVVVIDHTAAVVDVVAVVVLIAFAVVNMENGNDNVSQFLNNNLAKLNRIE